MYDIVAVYVSPDHIRDLSILSNFVAALVIGPWMAFATTQGAGFHCPTAFVRLIQRVVLVGLSITLMYNASLIYAENRTPIGSALILNILILISSLVSAWRHLGGPDIPRDASWKRRMVLKAELAPRA